MCSNNPVSLIILPLILLLAGCIHTYPTPGEDVDPTEISLSIRISLNEEWENRYVHIRESAGNSEGTRADSPLHRLYCDIRGNDSFHERISKKVSDEEIIDGEYVIFLPMKFKAAHYRIAIWYDYMDNSGENPAAYEISADNYITELRPRGEESDIRTCLSAVKDIDLSKYSGKWNTTEEIGITLSSPMARWRLIASDYQDFLDLTEEPRRRGEKYYIRLNYDSEIPGCFALCEGLAMQPVRAQRFTFPLPILTIPGIEMCVASDWLINPVDGHTHTVTVSVLNSALALVSQTPEISFPTERGKITTVSGKILTNFISGGISIDNLWDDEIIIEVN